jgi:hypothetical protein
LHRPDYRRECHDSHCRQRCCVTMIDIASGLCTKSRIFLCGPLRISAISAFEEPFYAEVAEIRREPQRKTQCRRTSSTFCAKPRVGKNRADAPGRHLFIGDSLYTIIDQRAHWASSVFCCLRFQLPYLHQCSCGCPSEYTSSKDR